MVRKQLVSSLHHTEPRYSPGTDRHHKDSGICDSINLQLEGSLFEGGAPRNLIEG